MKGFIEVTLYTKEKQIISIDSILRVYRTLDYTVIVTKELVSRYECSNDNNRIDTLHSFEEIKELIKNAQ